MGLFAWVPVSGNAVLVHILLVKHEPVNIRIARFFAVIAESKLYIRIEVLSHDAECADDLCVRVIFADSFYEFNIVRSVIFALFFLILAVAVVVRTEVDNDHIGFTLGEIPVECKRIELVILAPSIAEVCIVRRNKLCEDFLSVARVARDDAVTAE